MRDDFQLVKSIIQKDNALALAEKILAENYKALEKALAEKQLALGKKELALGKYKTLAV